jgi:hypothetical protein
VRALSVTLGILLVAIGGLVALAFGGVLLLASGLGDDGSAAGWAIVLGGLVGGLAMAAAGVWLVSAPGKKRPAPPAS